MAQPTSEIDRVLAEAGRAIAQGQESVGEAILYRLLAEDPTAVSALAELSDRLVTEGHGASYVSALLGIGQRGVDSGNYGLAEGVLTEAVSLQPDSAAALALLGQVLVRGRKYRSAEGPLRRAVDLGRDDLRTKIYLGSTLWENGEVDEAEEVFRQAVAASGKAAVAINQLGSLLLWQGRFDEAAGVLREATERSPGAAEVWLELARALEGAGRLGEALTAYTRTLELASEDSRARYGLGRLLLSKGDRQGAERQLEIYDSLYRREQEQTRRDGLQRGRIERAHELLRAGQAEAAIELLETLSEGPPGLSWSGAVLGSPMTSCDSFSLSDVTKSAGLKFRHRRGASGAKHLPETMGAGSAWLDFDGDGWWDLYLVQSGPFPPDGSRAAANRLLRNLGDGHFEDVTDASRTGHTGYGQGVVAGDVDGDGDDDLYVTNYGRDVLLVNLGEGVFADGTLQAGLGLDGWSSSAALVDADRDGDLDLYVSRYLAYDSQHELFCGDGKTGTRRYCDPSVFEGAADRFYRNEGQGTFSNATIEAGFGSATGRGLGVVFVDLDGDDWADIYVANDLTINLLFRNLGDGTFQNLSLLSGSAVNRQGKPEAGMGVAVGDVDGDLDPDLAVTNFDVETNTLYLNLGGLVFEDRSATSGFGLPSFNQLAFGIALRDFDRDGDLDFYVANGHIFERPKRENVAYRQRDQIFLGDGRGSFAEARCDFLDLRRTVARGLSAADFDNDGDPDLALQESDGPFALLRNDGSGGGWLGVELRGAPGNTEGVGARLVLSTEKARQVRWVMAGDSYQSSSDRRVLFGVGGEKALALEIVWPGGKKQRLLVPPTNRYLVAWQ